MCVNWHGEWVKAEKKMIAWKVVSVKNNEYYSYFHPDFRLGQDWTSVIPPSLGFNLKYVIGLPITSGSPGIYLFRTREGAREYTGDRKCFPSAILRVSISKGTLIRYGSVVGSVKSTINALRIKPLSVVR